jgi:putative iron-regulated protein
MFQLFFRSSIALFLLPTSLALATTTNIVNSYAQLVSSSYIQSADAAKKMETALKAFVATPSESTQQSAKEAWINARKAYSPTEVFRFYGGPIDAENGPEGLLNTWPLDEVYIDYVLGNPDAGIINDLLSYPTISKDLLRELNEKDGEKNISTGFHAIEFLLWGQDLNAKGPGKRKFSDYIVGQGKNADRRGQYLLIIAEMLVEDSNTLVKAWDLSDGKSYASSFVALENQKESLKNILLGAYTMAAEELSQERLFVAYDTQQQEDEQSCFSDTTHLDIYYNYMGVENVVRLFMKDLETKSTTLKTALHQQLLSLNQQTLNFPAPFDQAILDESKRPQILSVIRNLETLGDDLLKVADLYNVSLIEE